MEVTPSEASQNSELRSHLKKVLTQEVYTSQFNLKPSRINHWLEDLAINDDEIRFSPGYSSAGWGHNQTEKPQINESDLDPSPSNYEHEARHGLHNLKCQEIFESEDNLKFIELFKDNVLGDPEFVKQIDKPGGSPLQERMLNTVRDLLVKKDLSANEVKDNAWMFGALTYQHAYFVDPGMCEAVASLGDHGITLVVGSVNRWFATLLIPGEQFLEGYVNPEWQQKFKYSDDAHKALLVKGSDYNREKYWAS